MTGLLNAAARLIAAAVHEGVAEYRRLGTPEPDEPEMSCTAASTERAPAEVFEAPASAFGFRWPS